MPHLHLVLVRADSAKDAASCVKQHLNYRYVIGGIASEDGSDDI